MKNRTLWFLLGTYFFLGMEVASVGNHIKAMMYFAAMVIFAVSSIISHTNHDK